jgi:regulation of enolase protein 1 (concanavalin A-like superfamily)
MPQIDVTALPFVLDSAGTPSGHAPIVTAPSATEEEIRLTAAALGDLFCDPRGIKPPADGERFVAPVAGDFQLSAHVWVDYASTFDSGVLLGYIDDSTWFKICAELDPRGIPRVVTVVTRNGASDDSNGWPIPGSGVFLRISRFGAVFALHASGDGVSWELARYFTMHVPEEQPISVGILAQSPTGDGTTVVFSKLRFGTDTLADIRDGS